jgi:hypothetical protein
MIIANKCVNYFSARLQLVHEFNQTHLVSGVTGYIKTGCYKCHGSNTCDQFSPVQDDMIDYIRDVYVDCNIQDEYNNILQTGVNFDINNLEKIIGDEK